MSVIVYKNARILINGFDISAELHDLGVQYSAAMLDATTFGGNTKINKGGLFSASLSGTAYADFAALAPNLLYTNMGVDDAIIAVFPNGITEGAVCGYAMKGVEKDLSLGGVVGALEELKFSYESRGVSA